MLTPCSPPRVQESRPSRYPGTPRRDRRQPSPTLWCWATTTEPPYGRRSTAFGDDIAAVITEAAPGNMGVIPPGTEDGVGFNAFLAAIARAQRRPVHLRRGDDRLPGESIGTVRA